MNKALMLPLILMLWASLAAAQQSSGTGPSAIPEAEPEAPEALEQFDARIGADYRDVTLKGSARAGEYEFLKSSGSAALDLDWDPLPHRLVLESYFLNRKDYFGSLDYAYRDVVLFSGYTRGMHHNLDHFRFKADDPITASPNSLDKDPGADYAIQNQLQRAFIRFKTPDFPFHLYADMLTVFREGTKQQRFMRGFTGGLDRVSQSREIDWHTLEVRAGANSHLGPLEVDYSHSEKTFQALGENALFDVYAAPAMTIPHNLIPDLKSRADTVKVHTMYSGRFTAAATYTDGNKKNKDSESVIDYRNAAGDVTYMPVTSLILVAKYRHYDLDADNPNTVTLSGLGAAYRVRDALSSKRDVLSGLFRYRATRRMTVSGGYTFDTVARNSWHGESIAPLQLAPVPGGTGPDFWNVASRTTKGTVKLGADYRLMNRLIFRADASTTRIANPAYASDPDQADGARASLTWSPVQRVTMLVSYGGGREKRDELSAPLAGGGRKIEHDQALGSLTIPLGKRLSATGSYLYYRYKTMQTVTYRDLSGSFIREDGVPYADTAQVATASAVYAMNNRVSITAESSKSFSKGRFRNDGSVANTGGISAFSDLRVVEDIYSAGLEMRFCERVDGSLRYQQRRYDDKFDDTEDGTVQAALAAVSMKW